jgi:Ser-tRNA(Ala) deacylase AlaX
MDPYLADLDTRIAAVDGNDVTVEQTIFYALSGGQQSDAGTIGGRRVLQARKAGKEIVYTLEPGHDFKPGDPVRMRIDWARRYRLMRLHFAAEIVLELAYRNLESITKIGAHIGPDKARIDFEWPGNIGAALPLIREQAHQLIQADHTIVSAFSDEASEQRYWEIGGLARVPCGGTHLRRTGEVGAIELRRKNVGKGKERVEIYLEVS